MASSSKPKVICLGLGRTGTSSLREALEHLGFGPAYHMSTILANQDPEEFVRWRNISMVNDQAAVKTVHELLDAYGSALDYPMVMHPDAIYAAYPDAKYILMTRNPAKWETSMKATILKVPEWLQNSPNLSPLALGLQNFMEMDMEGKSFSRRPLAFHHGRLYTHTQQELLDHNARIKALIPPEKLLIYEVSDGWDKLVEFLGVPKPDLPFPHVNDTAQFQTAVKGLISGPS
ncbi:P-loop containing nucleoside triphosphate hydrolase protein [Hysterangium stoloniferum]|nr:P-loop containing nucleoside triphosphate hydrolase protein [Hysterangium stoloniferum]